MTNSSDRPVRTRFAPSPTGPLHIGGVRSALFAWLLARHYGGQFILRLEDTDQKRFVPGSQELITDALSWLGLDWNEGPDIGGAYGPYVQSERLDLYQKWAKWLVDNDKAYPCYCTAERLQQVNDEKQARKEKPGYDGHCRHLTAAERAEKEAQSLPSVIRLKVPLEGKVIAHDLIRGEIEFDNNTLNDIVLLKSDGFPTYHLAHVIDDHFMEISHITRANEWLPSFPTHVHIWEAFGWEMPQHAHLPVLLNPNGKGKLSKRHAGFTEDGRQVLVLASEFKEAGYMPEAVVNFLTNIGWNFGDEREVFDVAEAIERFDIREVNPANSAYPIEKLDWLNGVYLHEKLSVETLAQRLRPALEKTGLDVDEDTLRKVVPIIRVRIKTVDEVVDMAGFFFHKEFQEPTVEMLIPKKMDAASAKATLEAAYDVLVGLEDFSVDSQHQAMLNLAQQLGIKNGPLFGVLRVAVTGQQVSPPTFETMDVLGKDEALRRIQLAITKLATQAI